MLISSVLSAGERKYTANSDFFVLKCCVLKKICDIIYPLSLIYSSGFIHQEAILEKKRKNGPVTDYMLGTVRENTHIGSLLNWVRSFN